MWRFQSGFHWAIAGSAILFLAGPFHAVADDATAPAGNAASAQLQAIGGLSAVNAEHTYLLIVSVSDGVARGYYDTKSVRPQMNRIIRQLETCSSLLRRIQQQGLDEEDDELVELIVSVHARLHAQARALIVFSEIQGEAEARNLERARRAARQELDKMLESETDGALPDSAGSADEP
jgi:hypothetical protein